MKKINSVPYRVHMISNPFPLSFILCRIPTLTHNYPPLHLYRETITLIYGPSLWKVHRTSTCALTSLSAWLVFWLYVYLCTIMMPCCGACSLSVWAIPLTVHPLEQAIEFNISFACPWLQDELFNRQKSVRRYTCSGMAFSISHIPFKGISVVV